MASTTAELMCPLSCSVSSDHPKYLEERSPVCEWGAFAEGSDGSDGEGAEEAGLLGVASEGW